MGSVPEEYSLYNMENISRCKEDPEYLGKVMEANENLIWHSIHKYLGPPHRLVRNNGIDKDDILQLGRLGFIKAMKAFDTSRGVKFSSFAVTAIVREVRCYLRDKGNIIRLTRTAHTIQYSIKAVERDLGRAPSVEEIVDQLDLPKNKVVKVLRVAGYTAYLDDPGMGYLYTRLVSMQDSEVHELVIEDLYVEEVVDKLRNKLTELERTILDYRLKGVSQAQIAADLNISKVKVGRIVKKISKLFVGMKEAGEIHFVQEKRKQYP